MFEGKFQFNKDFKKEKPRKKERPREETLPILKYKEQIKETVANNDSSLIIGETGSGKTTQIPLMLRELLSKNSDKKIAITQPRRVAAQSIAKYTAKNLGCKVGEEVGYQTKGDIKISKDTRLNFLTDGFLLRKMQDDPLLKEYGAVVVDEAHERSLNIDLTLGLLKQIQKKRKEKGMDPLKIIVASATLEKEKFIDYFSGSPAVEVPGRLHKVDTYYEEEEVNDYTKAAAQKVKKIINQENQEDEAGDILIFMPGKAEIDKTIKEIEDLLLPNVLLIPLHSQVSPQQQNEIFRPTKERKIIVATNIAETSLTIPNIRYVVDSGLIKQLEYNPSTGIESLKTRLHAKSGCTQRKGRAGRVAPGKCWRLYTEESFNNRPEFSTPEIQRSELSQVVLRMKKMGIDDITSFDFIDQPPEENIKKAIKSLQLLGALDEEEKITKMGEKMAEFPLEPRLARMIIEAEKNNCVEDVCIIAAFLNAPPIFKRGKGDETLERLKEKKSDLLAFRKIWQEYANQNFSAKWAKENHLFTKTLFSIKETYFDLLKILKEENRGKNWKNYFKETQEPENFSEDLKEKISKSVAAGLIENLMEYKGRYVYKRLMGDDENSFYIHPASTLFKNDYQPKYLVAGRAIQTSKNFLSAVQEIKPSWLREIAPQLVYTKEKEIYYDYETNKVKRKLDIYLKKDDELIAEDEEIIEGEDLAPALAKFFVKENMNLPFIQHNKEIREKAREFWVRAEGKKIPQEIFSSEYLEKFYEQRLKNIYSLPALILALREKKINLNLDLNKIIPPQIQEKIEKESPSFINLLGKEYKVNYKYEKNEEENKENFIAYLEISPEEIIKLTEAPTLPSGKEILFKITTDEYSDLFSDEQEINFTEAKEKAKEYLIEKQRNNFDFQKALNKLEKEITRKNLASLPYILEPEPIVYGHDPETNEPLCAYPLFINKPSDLEIKYFFSEQEKEKYKKEAIQEKEKLEEKEKTEKEKEKIIKKLTNIKNSLEEIGAKEENNERLKPKQERRLERLINDFIKSVAGYKDTPLPEYWQKEIEEIEEEVKEIKEEKEKTEKAKKMAAEAIKKYCNRCPLCGHPLEDKHCPNALQHERGRIIFPEDKEIKGEFKEVWLSQIINEQGKIIAGLKAAPLDKTDRFSAAEIYLELGEEDLETGWLGEPFDYLEFKDLGKIIPPEEVKEKMAASEYYRQLKIAKKNVENEYWRKGKFKKRIHPKTGKIIWEKAFRLGTAQIIYEVDKNSYQPTNENLEYFYEEKESRNLDKYHRIIFVEIKKPFPEKAPKTKKSPKKKPSSRTSSQPKTPPSQDSLNSLLAKWGKKRK